MVRSLCPTCRLGDLPADISHCSTCHRTWPGDSSQVHCADCCHHFTSTTAFDIHRAGGECRDPQALISETGKPRLRVVRRKFGLAWAKYDDRPPPNALTGVGVRGGDVR